MIRALCLVLVFITSSGQAAENEDTYDVLLVRPMNRITCENWQLRLIDLGYRPSVFNGISPQNCESMDPESVVVAVRNSAEESAKLQTEAQPRLYWVNRPRVPDKIESMADVVNLVANFDVVTTRAFRMVVPADSGANGATVKIHRVTVPRGPEGGGGSTSYVELLFQVPLK